MEIKKLGCEKQAVVIRVPATVKKIFTQYIKARAKVEESEIELDLEKVFVSWLGAFEESEEYKNMLSLAEQKKADAKAEKERAKQEREAKKQQKKLERVAQLRKELEELEAN